MGDRVRSSAKTCEWLVELRGSVVVVRAGGMGVGFGEDGVGGFPEIFREVSCELVDVFASTEGDEVCLDSTTHNFRFDLNALVSYNFFLVTAVGNFEFERVVLDPRAVDTVVPVVPVPVVDEALRFAIGVEVSRMCANRVDTRSTASVREQRSRRCWSVLRDGIVAIFGLVTMRRRVWVVFRKVFEECLVGSRSFVAMPRSDGNRGWRIFLGRCLVLGFGLRGG